MKLIICHAFHGFYMACIPWQRPVFTCIRQNIKRSLSRALLYSFIIFKYVILILRKDDYTMGRIGLYFWGFGEKLNIFSGIWGGKANNYRETRTLFAGRQGDQCIIFRDQCWL